MNDRAGGSTVLALPGVRAGAAILAVLTGLSGGVLTASPGESGIRLRETATAWGLDFRHHSGAAGRRYLPETMGAGVIIFDFDNDGDQDVFFVDGGSLPGSPDDDYRSRLFRNDGKAGETGNARFIDYTDRAGLEFSGCGSGVAAGDIDSDGDLDLYVTLYGRNLLFVNRGDGSFTERGAAAGVADESWGSSAAFADPDRDGDLDLYLANYVDFSAAERTPCKQQGIEVYCHPGQYEGLPDRYFRNLGDGRFEDATSAVGMKASVPRAGLGVAFADFDNDGWPDLYVANDADPNFLFSNQGDGTFEEAALASGAAYGDTGRPEAGMGVAVGDTDGDRRLDIFVTNFELETNALYRNLSNGLFTLFTDTRFAANIAEPSLLSLAFGVDLADLDQDGDLDLAVANGHILDNVAEFHERSRYPQLNQLFENIGSGRFRELGDAGIGAPRVSRGLATGDLDNDGDLDIVVSNTADVAEVYENRSESGHWLQAEFRGASGNRFGVGARIELWTGEDPSSGQVREIRTGGSYLSQGALSAHFGLAGQTRLRSLAVRRADGRRVRYQQPPSGRRLQLAQ